MTGYQRPTTAPVSSSWADHMNRNPPSSEPGTDYGCGYGTPLVAPEAGTITDAKSSPGGATGRYLTLTLDDGRTVRWLHLSSYTLVRGERFGRGQVIAYSGASANGSDWGVGAHVHVTLWPGAIWAAPTIDFEAHVGEEDDMTPAQADQLNNIYNAVFYGGPSMPDGNRSLGQSLADLAAGARPVVVRPDASGGSTVNTYIQELADVRTAQINAADESNTASIKGPAWLIGAVLVLIGVVEVARLIIELIVI